MLEGIIQDMETQKLVQMIKESVPDVQAIYLFGSQVDQTARADSDVDLAILVRSKPTGELMFA